MKYLKMAFGIDLRTLALFRVFFATMIIVDLISRARDFTEFYTNSGIIPIHTSVSLASKYDWSLYWLSNHPWLTYILFAIAGFSAFLLLIGYKTRLVSIISWVFLASINNRNMEVGSSADVLIMCMSFWAILLPIGARFSVDSSLNKKYQDDPNTPPTDHNYFSIVSAAALLQVMYLYFFTALLKTGSPWTETMDAAYYAVNLEHMTTFIAAWMRDYPQILTIGTYFVWYLEIIVLFLVFSPIFHLQLRLLSLVCLIALHSTFFLTLHIDIFPFVDFMSLTLLIPGAFWNWLSKYNDKPKRSEIIIFYDEDCGFCKKTCLILRNFLISENSKILPAQPNPDIYPIMQRENSWVVRDHEGKLHIHWHGIQYLCKASLIFRPIGIIMGWTPLINVGNKLYRWVAVNRGKMGRFSERFLPYGDVRDRATKLDNAVGLCAFYIVTYYNVSGVSQWGIDRPEYIHAIARTARISQHWGMFAPKPPFYSIMPVIEGKTRDGRVVDVYNMSFEPPQQTIDNLSPSYFKSDRWIKFFNRLHEYRRETILSKYGSFLCRKWNSRDISRDDQLATFSIVFKRLETLPDSQPKPLSSRFVWKHWCYSEFAPK